MADNTDTKYIVAVSGGVDSVVLLDMLATGRISEAGTSGSHELEMEQQFLSERLIVAHFDHGIREDSAEDARFVEGLAKQYGLEFVTRREELGFNASEELARDRRYAFLRELSKKEDSWVVTAHHMNDVAESIAINITRGTGWRGLAVMDSEAMLLRRPLLDKTKQELLDYALHYHLEWREDSTNISDMYLRNRLRRKLTDESLVRQLYTLRNQQVTIKQAMHEELMQVIGYTAPSYSRYFFSQIEPAVALECIHMLTHAQLTRPQAKRMLLAIKTQKAGTQYEAGGGVKIDFTTRFFSVTMVK